MNLQLLKARQTKYVAYATLYIAVVLAIVSTANFLANRYNKTYDATANKRYSLSEQTAKIVKGIKRTPRITYFDQGTRFERAKDQLDLTRIFLPRSMLNTLTPIRSPNWPAKPESRATAPPSSRSTPRKKKRKAPARKTSPAHSSAP